MVLYQSSKLMKKRRQGREMNVFHAYGNRDYFKNNFRLLRTV
jgi:hypothetical protein